MHAAVTTLLHEMKLVQRSNHNLENEKNKLKSDLVRCRYVADVGQCLENGEFNWKSLTTYFGWVLGSFQIKPHATKGLFLNTFSRSMQLFLYCRIVFSIPSIMKHRLHVCRGPMRGLPPWPWRWTSKPTDKSESLRQNLRWWSEAILRLKFTAGTKICAKNVKSNI